MVTKKLTTQPYNGTKDLYPVDFRVQKYIFDKWREVCLSFGYEEYQTPLLEFAGIYKEKSGEDVGGKELFTLTDMGGRDLALRPELTPSVTRMVCRKYKELPKPIRLFSIGSFYRNETPQRGRNREFWQLNADIFGEKSLEADIEILQLALELMLIFNPPKGSFKLYINNRKLLNALFDSLEIENRTEVSRVLDKYKKIPQEKIIEMLYDLNIDKNKVEKLMEFVDGDIDESLKQTEGYTEIMNLLSALKSLGYEDFIDFNTSLIRGFDYYDGMVFEVFDTSTENSRSLFGGGRYNGLAGIFGEEDFPAVGFAPGEETTRLFLETWNLLPKDLSEPKYFLFTTINPTKDENIRPFVYRVAKKIRSEDKNNVVCDLSYNISSIQEGLREANKRNYNFVVIVGDEEYEKRGYTVKNMETGQQTFFNI